MKKELAFFNLAVQFSLTAGEILNLMNVDVQKLAETSLCAHMFWSYPLQVGLSIYFLYQTINVAVFVGMQHF